MDLTLSGLYELLTEALYIDLKNAKPLSEKQVERFKRYFAIESEIEDLGLFYNEFNLIITEKSTFAELEPFMKSERIAAQAEHREHNRFICIYPYFNENLFRQALEGRPEDE